MPLPTTTIGSFPKPDYLTTKDWFSFGSTMGSDATHHTNSATPESGEVLDRAAREVVASQVEIGIDIPTDGEVRRENYIHYHCRNLNGIDFDQLTTRTLRNGAWVGEVPTFVSKVTPRDHFLVHDYLVASSVTDWPVKITMPGPITIMDTTADDFYGNDRELGKDLAAALNYEALALADAGCRVIQVDEPCFARYPDKALDYGFDLLESIFAGLPETVTRTVHMCCGYPERVDSEVYEKADPMVYHQLADAINSSSIDAISLEDAHRSNDLSLFEAFTDTDVILGVVGIARSRVESVAEIIERATAVLERTGPDRLILGPDCGLAMLPRAIAEAKLANIVTAAAQIG
jgi:5-methyltetrahydropteroyltriglutamate--homocysteine methyltransferase